MTYLPSFACLVEAVSKVAFLHFVVAADNQSESAASEHQGDLLIDIPADELLTLLQILISLQLMGMPHNINVKRRHMKRIRSA